jgi:hypothetical protein
MDNKMEERNIKIYDDKVEVHYTSGGAGCLLFAGGTMTLTGLFILFYIVPDSNIVRGFIGIIIGTIALLFSGTMFLKVLSATLSGKAVYAVQEGYFKGKKKAVRISEITDMRWAGTAMKYLVIQTIDKKITKLSSYNLVPVEKVNQVIEEYVVPNATPELKQNWANSKREA